MTYSEEVFTNYFGQDDDQEYLAVHKWNQESYEDNFSDLLPRDRGARILEIGCGAGQLLYYLKAKGYGNIEGIDLGEQQIGYLKRYGIDGHVVSSIPDYFKDVSKRGRYDLIIMNEVIEHFPKKELFDNLAAIREGLKEKGFFVFATPNMACLSGLFQRDIDLTHEIGFTERSAYQMMRIAGFKDIIIRPDRIVPRLRPKRIMWCCLNWLWYKILGFLHYVERGMDRPRILSRTLIVIGKK